MNIPDAGDVLSLTESRLGRPEPGPVDFGSSESAATGIDDGCCRTGDVLAWFWNRRKILRLGRNAQCAVQATVANLRQKAISHHSSVVDRRRRVDDIPVGSEPDPGLRFANIPSPLGGVHDGTFRAGGVLGSSVVQSALPTFGTRWGSWLDRITSPL